MDNISQEVTLIIVSSVFLLIVAIGIIILVLVYQKKQLVYLNEKEQIKVSYEKEILESKLEIQEQTFKLMSQEIHDNIGQILSLAKLNLNRIDLNNGENTEVKINDAKELISKAIQDLRDLSKTMNADNIASMGLIKAIELELNLIQKTGAIQTELKSNFSTLNLNAQKQVVLFRIVQEGFNNIIKHAEASHISVEAILENSNLHLHIIDNGTGFNIAEDDKFGSGLRNMQSRSKLIGADYVIKSSQNQGTQICITIPII